MVTLIQLFPLLCVVSVIGGDGLAQVVGGDADEPVNEAAAHWRARLSLELANYSDYPPSDPAPTLHPTSDYSTLHTTELHRGLHQIGGKNDLIVICGPAGALINHTAG